MCGCKLPEMGLPNQRKPDSSERPIHAGQARLIHRVLYCVEWALPIATLLLVPKCPFCLAASVFVVSGIGLSVVAATVLRWMLIFSSMLAMSYLILRWAKPMTAARN